MNGIRLILGDCVEVMREMDAASFDSIVTDPPFKISQEYSASADPDNLLAVSSICFAGAEMFRLAKPGAICAMFYDTRILPLALAAMKNAGWKYVRALTLYRACGVAHLLGGWMSKSDFILIFAKPGVKPKFYGPPQPDTYIRKTFEDEQIDHPARKPLDAMRHIVKNVTPPGGLVLDPYAGVGTTGLAAMLEDRAFLGIEIEPQYVEAAELRIATWKKRAEQMELAAV